MRHPLFAIVAAVGSLVGPSFNAQPGKPSEDAWPLLAKAIAHVEQGYREKIESPTASSLNYRDFPPFPLAWMEKEKQTYAFNAPARALLHEARAMTASHWPTLPPPGPWRFLNQSRSLSNEVADAILYEHLQRDDAAAIETARDLLHLGDLLDNTPESAVVQALVGAGVRQSALHRLQVVLSDISLTNDPAVPKRLQVRIARELLRELMDSDDPQKRFEALLAHDPGMNEPQQAASKDRLLVNLQRVQMEKRLTAMSLACHLFYLDKMRWPQSVEEIAPYLPGPMQDAWGLLGYVLVKGALPDGGDRPMVYSHHLSKDGLFFLVNEPTYSFYIGDGSNLPRKDQKEGGQFRDVSHWLPSETQPAPATRPIREK